MTRLHGAKQAWHNRFKLFMVFIDNKTRGYCYCIVYAHDKKEAIERVAKEYQMVIASQFVAHEVELNKNNVSNIYEIDLSVNEVEYK